MQQIRAYLDEVSGLIQDLPVDKIDSFVRRLMDAYDDGRQLFLLGNGGSAATASHLLADFQKCIYMAGGKTFRALAVTDSIPLITAWANDTHYDNVFAEQIRPWLQPGDLVIAISGSGNSPNVLRAVQVARELGAYVLGLAGYQGGKLESMADDCIVVPCDNMQRIEDGHLVIGHILFWRMMGHIRERQTAGTTAAGAGR